MNTRQFDIAIVGHSLSSAITAALLAKNGLKIIRLGTPDGLETGWSFSSLFLEKLLGLLGGRSCFTSPAPFQVLSKHSRVTIHNEISIQEELSREFGAEAATANALLGQLLDSGTRLNLLLWENLGLPWPELASQVRFRYHCMRHKLSSADLTAPLKCRLDSLESGPREFLTNLFQGLSLRPLEGLTLADASLLWSQANRPENVSEPEFFRLLDKRFEQFHGTSEILEDLESLEFKGDTFIEGKIKGRGGFRASHLLIGHLACAAKWVPARLMPATAHTALSRYTTSDLDGRVSPLLADQVIIGAPVPLRLSLAKGPMATTGSIICPASVPLSDLKGILEVALPFASYELKAAPPFADNPGQDKPAPPRPQGLSAFGLQLGRNILCADSGIMYPGMAAAGGALLGWTLLNRLCGKRVDGK